MRQQAKALIAHALEGGDYLRGIASLEQDSYALFEGVGKRTQGWEMKMVGMLMGYPKVVNTIEQRESQDWFGTQRPRVIENFPGQPWVHQDRGAGAFDDYACMSDELNFHFFQ